MKRMSLALAALIQLTALAAFALPPNPNQGGSLCVSGEFEIRGANNTKAAYSFQLTGEPRKDGLFYSEILNPDEDFNTGERVSKVGTQFRRDSLLLRPIVGVRCPCDAFESADGRFSIILEQQGDGKLSPTINYFGLETTVTKIERCK